MELKFVSHFQLSMSKLNCSWMKKLEKGNMMELLIVSRKLCAVTEFWVSTVGCLFSSMALFQNLPLGKSNVKFVSINRHNFNEIIM